MQLVPPIFLGYNFLMKKIIIIIIAIVVVVGGVWFYKNNVTRTNMSPKETYKVINDELARTKSFDEYVAVMLKYTSSKSDNSEFKDMVANMDDTEKENFFKYLQENNIIPTDAQLSEKLTDSEHATVSWNDSDNKTKSIDMEIDGGSWKIK